MTIEQKAKAYEEALKRAKVFKEHLLEINDKGYADEIDYIFPELKDSEDEKIRKALIEMFSSVGKKDWRGIPTEKIIEWLEKQGEHKSYCQRKECIDCQFNYAGECKGSCQMKRDEQNPVDKVEPKFKVGNWYQCTKDFFGKGVTFDKNTAYYCAKEGCLQNEYRCHIAIVKGLYDNFKLWDISDAKDGDVLLTKHNQPFIYNGIFDEESVGAYCGIDMLGNDFLKGIFSCDWSYKEGVKPATKEQRNILFAKMKESGYEWDADKKELKNIKS